jgi:hypothetical protein
MDTKNRARGSTSFIEYYFRDKFDWRAFRCFFDLSFDASFEASNFVYGVGCVCCCQSYLGPSISGSASLMVMYGALPYLGLILVLCPL